MNARVGRWSAALFLGVLLSLLCILPCFAAGGVSQVNLHIGQTPDSVYLTYSAPDAAQGAVSVTGPEGMRAAYTAAPVWSDSAGKYLYSARLDDLAPGSFYTYNISGIYTGSFQTPADSGTFTFAFLADPQICFSSDAKATGALFSLLNKRDDLAFTYLAGDLTDSSRKERQWELLFQSGGVNSSAGQSFMGSRLLAVAQGNHDNSSFSGHITAPSAGSDVGPAVYSFNYSNMKFVVLNLNSSDTWRHRRTSCAGRRLRQKQMTSGLWWVFTSPSIPAPRTLWTPASSPPASSGRPCWRNWGWMWCYRDMTTSMPRDL